MKPSILIVEDELKLQEFINLYMKNAGYNTTLAADGIAALELFEKNTYDLIILDLMIPGLNGFEVCKKIRSVSTLPIIMLTALEGEQDQIEGYDLGADDYVTKPFKINILLAKVRRFLEKQPPNTHARAPEASPTESSDALLHFGQLTINLNSRQLFIDKNEIILAPKEYELLIYLAKNYEIALSRNQILNAVWGYEFTGTTRVVDNHIKKLRGKLGPLSHFIDTVISHGYRFCSDAEDNEELDHHDA